MLFHRFATPQARRAFGGSDFLEFQYCRCAPGTSLQRIVSVDAVAHWQPDSLYLSGDDLALFTEHYGKIFCGGYYNNGKTGPMDPCGINYYPPQLTRRIMAQIRTAQPPDGQILLDWLSQQAAEDTGFYLLGL